MKIHNDTTSTVIVHHVPIKSIDRYMQWQRGISRAAESFFGYEETDVYPPTEKGQLNWVSVMHFNSPNTLQQWLESPERSYWLAKMPSETEDYRQKVLVGGFAPWFTDLLTTPSDWKIALTVLLGLYPTVMIINILLNPYLSHLGLAISLLIGDIISVSILQWVLMPAINKLLSAWLQAYGRQQRALSIGGTVGIVLLLLVMVALFRLVKT